MDGLSPMVLGNKNDTVKVLSWYDNEWGFSCRLVDLIKLIAQENDDPEIAKSIYQINN